MKPINTLLLYCGLWILLAACDSEMVSTSTMIQSITVTHTSVTQTMEPTETKVDPSPTITRKPPTVTVTGILPTSTSVPACVTLHYGGYAQFEIISPFGQRVLIDVYDPDRLTRPAEADDVLLTTHTHWDHLNEEFQKNFPGLQLFVESGLLELPIAAIHGISSAHNEGDRLKPVGGTNYIYLIEVDGLRIAHFGDIGQTTLNKDQLNALGQVDIAITQINNPYSDMNADNRKGINLMEQVNPKLIIPTHFNLDTVKAALSNWVGYYHENSTVLICKSDLSEDLTQILLLGESVETMVKYVKLYVWEEK
jgi:hypothetical protein